MPRSKKRSMRCYNKAANRVQISRLDILQAGIPATQQWYNQGEVSSGAGGHLSGSCAQIFTSHVAPPGQKVAAKKPNWLVRIVQLSPNSQVTVYLLEQQARHLLINDDGTPFLKHCAPHSPAGPCLPPAAGEAPPHGQ
eukprot:1151981-Pelagomonas_calceolata.AAC.1